MLSVFRPSGQEVATIPVNRLVNVRGLKQHLRLLLGVPRFKQRILYQGSVLEDETRFYADLDIEVVLIVVPFCGPSQKQRHQFLRAAIDGNFSKVEAMLHRPHDPDLAAENGDTALLLASHAGHVEVARLLLEAGAGVDIADADGETPLILASDLGSVELVRLLLEVRADLDTSDTDGETALILASDLGSLESVHLLLEASASVNIADEDGSTALIAASHAGHVEVVRLLLEASAGADIADTDGFTALLHACILGHEEVACLLLRAGADKEFVYSQGTILHHASSAGHYNIVQLLLNAGADKFRRYSRKAWMHAIERGHEEISNLLLSSTCHGWDWRAIIRNIFAVEMIQNPKDFLWFWCCGIPIVTVGVLSTDLDDLFALIASMSCLAQAIPSPTPLTAFCRCELTVARLLWEAYFGRLLVREEKSSWQWPRGQR